MYQEMYADFGADGSGAKKNVVSTQKNDNRFKVENIIGHVPDTTDLNLVLETVSQLFISSEDSYNLFKKQQSVLFKDERINRVADIDFNNYELPQLVEKNVRKLGNSMKSIAFNKFNNLEDRFYHQILPFIPSQKDKFLEKFIETKESIHQINFNFVRLELQIEKQNVGIQKSIDLYEKNLSLMGRYFYFLKKTSEIIRNDEYLTLIDKHQLNRFRTTKENALRLTEEELLQAVGILMQYNILLTSLKQVYEANLKYINLMKNNIKNAELIIKSMDSQANIMQYKSPEEMNEISEKIEKTAKMYSEEVEKIKQGVGK